MDQQQPYTTIGSEEQQTDRPWRRSAGFAIAALLYLTTVALTSRHGGQKVVEQATAAASVSLHSEKAWIRMRRTNARIYDSSIARTEHN